MYFENIIKNTDETIDNLSLIQFDDWCVLPLSCELKDTEGAIHKVEPRIMKALCYFLENANKVISREQLINIVWAENIVVTDHSLTQLLGNLRKTLGDNSKEPKYIETIPKKGYRFIGNIIDKSIDNDLLKTEHQNKSKTSLNINKNIISISLVLIAILFVFIFQHFAGGFPEHNLAKIRSQERSLTNLPGVERFPSVSPNGEWLVFSWENYQKPSNLYLLSLEDELAKPIALTNTNVKEMGPVWSPDNRYIAFVRMTGENECAVIKLNIATKQEYFITRCGDNQFSGDTLAWAPDGSIYFSRPKEISSNESIGIYNEDKSITALPCRLFCKYGDMDISWSPLGNQFVVTRQINLTGQDLFLYSADFSRIETRISFDEVQILGHSFSDDGKTLFYSTLKNNTPEIWQFNFEDKQHSLVTSDNQVAIYPTVLRGKNQLIYSKQERIFYIGQVNLNELPPVISPLIQSYSSNFDPAYDAKSKRLAYTSDISGHSEVWVSDIHNSQYQQITQSKIGALSPSWSKDGSKLTYIIYNTKDKASIEWRDMKNKMTHSIDTELTDLWGPQFNLEHNAIQVSAVENGKRYIWKISLEDDKATVISGEGALVGKISKNSGRLFYTKENIDGLWSFEQSSTTEKLLLADLKAKNGSNWLEYEGSIIYLDNKNQKDRIVQYDLENHSSSVLAILPKNTISQYAAGSFSIRTDNNKNYLLFVHNGILQGDIMITDIL